jgi:hypothetical protein
VSAIFSRPFTSATPAGALTYGKIFFNSIAVVRNHRFQMRIVEETLRELRHVDGHGHDARISPVQLGHALGRIQAVQALRVEIEDQDLALLQRIGLPLTVTVSGAFVPVWRMAATP